MVFTNAMSATNDAQLASPRVDALVLSRLRSDLSVCSGFMSVELKGQVNSFLNLAFECVFVANYIQQRQVQMMLIWTYFVKWLIPVIVFTLSSC